MQPLPRIWLLPSCSNSGNISSTKPVISSICIARTKCSNTLKHKHTNTAWSSSKKISLPQDQTNSTFNLRFKSCKQFMLVLLFIASSLTEISKKWVHKSLAQNRQGEEKKHYSLLAIDLLNPSNWHPKWKLDPLTPNPVLQSFSLSVFCSPT